MGPTTRNIVGVITSSLWLATGVYMIFRGIDETWRAIGFVVVAVGVWRAIRLVREWKKGVSAHDERS